MIAPLLSLALVALTVQGSSVDPDSMLNLATADQPLVHSATVNAPVAAVWDAYTTTEGSKRWMVGSGTTETKVGVLMRTRETAKSKLEGADVIENRILAFDPRRMLTIQCVRTPEQFPFKKAIAKVWTVLYFEPVGEKKTKVVCRMLGWDGSAESTQMRRFFMKGNQQELDELVKYFDK